MLSRLVAVMVCTVACLQAAYAENTTQLIVTLDTPDDTLPELFCVIGSQKCAGAHCHEIAEIESAMQLDSGRVTFDDKALKQRMSDEAVHAALGSLSRTPAAGCKQCRPSMQLIDDMQSRAAGPGHLAGFIVCARNSRPTHSDRVALTYLKFNGRSTTAVPLRALEFMGNQVTINFGMALNIEAYEFLLGIGGDYLEDTTGLGTKERMSLRLNPRCTLDTIRVPGRLPRPGERRSITLDGEQLDQCGDESNGALSVWLPHRMSPVTSKLQIDYIRAGGHDMDDVYEAVWTATAPPRPLKIQERRAEFTWRKDCLAGVLPAGGDSSWSASCPKATLPLAGANCEVDESKGLCDYRCSAPSTMQAFDLPTPVHFERYGMWDESESRLAYDWTDTLVYAGQELSSFVAPPDRKIIVEFSVPDEWQSHSGNELDKVDVKVDARAAQSILIGGRAPPWVAVAAPGVTCASRFTIDIVGSRSFVSKEQGLESTTRSKGNLVITTPSDYRDLFHWTAALGIGLLSPLNEMIGGFEAKPYISATGGFELYFARPFSGAVEVNLHYEPTFTSYGALRLTRRQDDQFVTVPYHRGATTIGASIWGKHRDWEAGLMGGPGIGGPIFGDVEKVGALRLFGLVGGFYRYRPSAFHAWLQFNVGMRWGEHHEYFGSDDNGAIVADAFHGEPPLTERALWQAYASAQFRVVFK